MKIIVREATIEEKLEDLKATLIPGEDPPETEMILDQMFILAKEKPAENVPEKIKNLSREANYDYLEAVKLYLAMANNSESLFEKVFFEEFQNAKDDVFIALKTMEYQKLYDMIELDIEQSLSGKTEVLFHDILEIYSRAQDTFPILIVGETGTSKELLARAIHKMSKRRKEPFREINCAAFPETLLEGELFGYKRGAFTGAFKDKKGLLAMANKGTLLLDELGKMPKHLQAKLLKVVDEEKILPLGEEDPVDIDVRFLAAAQPSDLDNILLDLKSRLSFPDTINLPTLTERFKNLSQESQIQLIKNSLLELFKERGISGKEVVIDEEVIKLLVGYEYKGNYREFKNILNNALRSAIMHQRRNILPEDLRLIKAKPAEKIAKDPIWDRLKELLEGNLTDLFDQLDKLEIDLIERKVGLALQSGKDLKSILLRQGLPEKEYQNFWKKVRSKTGKSLKQISKLRSNP